jgi:ribonuclease J
MKNQELNKGKGTGRSTRTKTQAKAKAKTKAGAKPKAKSATGKPAHRAPKKNASPLKVIPLGGLNEIGKNMTLLEYKDDIIIIDCGMSFPDDGMYGIDSVIPDFDYVIKNSEKLKGVILTHGHEDHIGGIPYLLRMVRCPIYGTRLTLGLVENKLIEHGIDADLNIIYAGDTIKLGVFEIETIRTTHSIADAVCFAINTPAGTIFHTGDFKIDYTPVDGEPIDLGRFAEIGNKGVKLLMMDSTNALRPGFTASEKVVGQTLETIFQGVTSRIIIATFSSNVHRVQKIVNTAVKFGRKVAISGRSMENVVNLAIDLGYITIPAGVLVDINKIKNIPDKELVIITTGSQGEPMSALTRMATNDHKFVQIKKGDCIILSSTPVPGNENAVSNVVNLLFQKGAEVIYSDIADIHVSGHACREELKLMHSLLKPEYFMPVHGEFRHLKTHKDLAISLGQKEDHVFILENGDCLSIAGKTVTKTEGVASGEAVLVDGYGVGDVGNIVLRDRKMLSEAGLIIIVAAIEDATNEIVSGPDLISRGFVYVRENEDLMGAAREVVTDVLDKYMSSGVSDWNILKGKVRDALKSFIYENTGRTPVILPIFMEI